VHDSSKDGLRVPSQTLKHYMEQFLGGQTKHCTCTTLSMDWKT